MSSIGQDIVNLQNLTSELRKSNSLNFSEVDDQIVDLATRHFELHQQVESLVNQLKEKGLEVPKATISELNKSKNNIKIISKKIANAVFAQKTPQTQEEYLDPSKLLTTATPKPKPSLPYVREWEINCGLLYSIYQRTDDEEIRTTLRFLIINYLAKAAYLNENPGIMLSTDEYMTCYQHMLQIGSLTLGGMYHRGMDQMQPLINMLNMEDIIGSRSDESSYMAPLETTEIDGLYPTGFHPVTDISDRDQAVEILAEQFKRNRDLPFEEVPEFPVLIDITDRIGQSLITHNEKDKVAIYEEKKTESKNEIEEIFKLAIKKIQTEYPEIDDTKILDYLRANTVVASRAKVNDSLAVLMIYDLYSLNDISNADKFHRMPGILPSAVKSWAARTALNPGAVNFRMLLANRYADFENPKEYQNIISKIPEYAVPGKTNSIMYNTPQALLQTNSFKSLRDIGEGKVPQAGKAQQLMAKATVQMMETFFQEIDEMMFQNLPEDPVAQKAMEQRLAFLAHPSIQELIQTSTFRLSQHLATATFHSDDFRTFIQGVDLIHTELTTLLLLFKPFDVKAYDEIHTMYLSETIPDSRLITSIGVARSAMNVFTGVNAAVIHNNPNPVRICGDHSYYEEAEFVGGTLTLKNALSDPNIKKVDLYVAEFNHNIDIDPKHTVYEKGTVIQDVREIFEKKPDTDSLTVAIDATLDLTNSKDLKDFINEFKDEISSGRLNIVVFRSGQKFDMLGLDNYFGAPFYIINNGSEKWSEFGKIKTDEVYQTDSLSLQFFTWMAQSGLNLPDEYKDLIFQNTRAILDQVPEGLQPSEEKRACVCTFNKDVKSPFIDIKINRLDNSGDQVDDQEELRRWVQTRFAEIFIDEKKLVYMRGSFGFPNPNITWIEPKMRINPGIDPSDIPLFVKFLNELDVKIKDMGMDRGEARPRESNPF